MPDTHKSDSFADATAHKPPAARDRAELVLSILLLGMITVCVFAQWLFFGKAFYWGDIGLFFLPLNQFLKTSIASGHIPLWNPYLFCGAPFVGNPQVSLVYFSTALLGLFPTATSIMISEVAHIFAAGAFFWLLARKGSFKLSAEGAILSATVYMLCGYFIAKAQFPNMLAALTYVPLVLYQTELLVSTPSLRRTAIFGACLALQLLAAHTQITVFTLYLAVPYGLLVYFNATERRSFIKVLQMAIGGGIFAGGLACCYWLPVAELIRSSARQTLTLHIANRFYLPWYEVGNFVLPHLYGSPMAGNWHAHGNYWETDNYVGLLPFVLAGYAIFHFKNVVAHNEGNKNQFVFWAITFTVSLWLSLGSQGGLYRVAFVLLPLLKAFHDPGRLMLGATIALSLFAGCGIEQLSQLFPVKLKQACFCLVLLLSVIDLGCHDNHIYPLKPVSAIQAMADCPVSGLVGAGLTGDGGARVLMPDSAKAWQSFTNYKSYEEDDPTFLTEWPNTLSPCLGMSFGLREAGGYDPEYRRDSQMLVDFAEEPLAQRKVSAGGLAQYRTSHLADFMSVLAIKYLVDYRVDALDVPGLEQIYQSPWARKHRTVRVYRNDRFVARAMAYTHWTDVQSQADAMYFLSSQIDADSMKSSFESPVVEKGPLSPPGSKPAVAAEFSVDEPDEVSLETLPTDTPELIVLADTDHPGWTVTLDGHSAAIYRANGDQRAVYIPGSSEEVSHKVDFIYRPADFEVGMYISMLMLSAFLTILLGIRRERYTTDG